MTTSSVMEVLQNALMAAVKLSAPILIISMVVGLIISIFQAATQIHEQTITFVPKLFAIVVVLLLLGPWMIDSMKDFITYIFDAIVNLT